MKKSEKVVIEQISDKIIYRDPEFDIETILAAVSRHKQICRLMTPELIKITPKSALSRFSLSASDERNVYVKEFSNRGPIRWLETVFYVHRGKRAWRAGNVLRARGAACAGLVALVEEKRFGLPHTSYLLMQEIAGADQLNHHLVREFFPNRPLTREEIRRKRTLIHAGAAALSEFHKKGIYHKDLSAKNVLVEVADDGSVQFYCVDMDSIIFPWRLSLRRRIKNLAQLNGQPGCVTTTDKIRFYMDYFNLQTLAPKHKFVIRLTRRLSRKRVERVLRLDESLREQLCSQEKNNEDSTPSQ